LAKGHVTCTNIMLKAVQLHFKFQLCAWGCLNRPEQCRAS